MVAHRVSVAADFSNSKACLSLYVYSGEDETLYDDLNLDNEAEVQFGMTGDKDLQSDGLSNLRWVNLAAST
ncbi:general negative regulator of transcription subunit 5 [Aspergillus tubingensis]